MLFSRLLLLCLCIKQLVTERCYTPDRQVGQCQALGSCPEMLQALANPEKGSEEHLRQLLCDNGKKVCCGVSLDYIASARRNATPHFVEDAAVEIHLSDAVKCDSGSFSSEDEFALPSLPTIRVKDLKSGVEFTKCIGALINERYVLTSARCVMQDNQGHTNKFSVVGVRFEMNDNSEKDFGIEEQLPHPFHIEDDGINDLALLRLNSTITDDNIQPTCLLPHSQEIFGKPGNKFVTVGRLATLSKNQRSSNNIAISTDQLSTKRCTRFMKKNANTTITKYNLCTTDIKNTTIACDGYDSVPVFFFSYGGHLLKGISSRRICADGLPEVYTKLDTYFDWILDSMRPWPVSNVQCKTPTGETGNCVSLRYCPAVMEEFGNPDKGLENQLLKFICTDEQESLTDVSNVCCSISSNPGSFENNRSIPNSTILHGFFEPERCGIQHRDDYFASDDILTLDEYPWIVRLIIGPNDSEEELDHSLCTGSLINARYVITAASCLRSFEAIDTVRLGDFNQRNKTDCFVEEIGTDCSEYEDHRIEEKIIHPFYLSTASINNIALIRLNKTVSYTDYIRPICVPKPQTKTANPGDVLYTSGWGWNRENYFVEIKKKVSSTLIKNSECRHIFSKSRTATFISSFDMCTMDFANNTEFACVFDHGGPLIFHNKFQWHIEGILSASNSYVCNEKTPVRYTRVAKYYEWILENMRPWKEMFRINF